MFNIKKIQNKKNGKIFTIVKEGENTVTISDQNGVEKELKISTVKKSYKKPGEVALTTIPEVEQEIINEEEMVEMETANIIEQEVQKIEVEVQEPQEQEVQTEVQEVVQENTETEVLQQTQPTQEVKEELNTVEFLKTQDSSVFDNDSLTEIDKVFVDFINKCGDNLIVRPTKYFTTIYKKVEGKRNKMLAECEIQKKAVRIFINKKHLGEHSINLSDTGISSIGECSYKIPFDEFNNQNISGIVKIVLDDLAKIITE